MYKLQVFEWGSELDGCSWCKDYLDYQPRFFSFKWTSWVKWAEMENVNTDLNLNEDRSDDRLFTWTKSHSMRDSINSLHINAQLDYLINCKGFFSNAHNNCTDLIYENKNFFFRKNTTFAVNIERFLTKCFLSQFKEYDKKITPAI